MCFFIYPQCDRCRWPEINNISGVKLCDAFEKLAHDPRTRVAVSAPDPSPDELSNWRCLGLYTFVRANGANYEIWMQRECLRWGPELGSHLCAHCEERDARLNAAFQLAADQLAEQADHANLQASVTGSLLGLDPAIQEPVHQGLGFDPLETVVETNVDWETLMGPSPLRSWCAMEAKQPSLCPSSVGQ